jgi:hypothetical protein
MGARFCVPGARLLPGTPGQLRGAYRATWTRSNRGRGGVDLTNLASMPAGDMCTDVKTLAPDQPDLLAYGWQSRWQ